MYFMEKIINKIKSNKKGEYSLYIEDEKLVINQDIYTDYFLYEGKKLNDDEYQEIKNKIEVSSAKVYVLNLLKQKMYSSYELKEKLFNIKKMSKDKIDILIDDLISKKLIDDIVLLLIKESLLPIQKNFIMNTIINVMVIIKSKMNFI